MSASEFNDESGKLPDGGVPPPVTPKGKKAKGNGEDPTPPEAEAKLNGEDGADQAPEVEVRPPNGKGPPPDAAAASPPDGEEAPPEAAAPGTKKPELKVVADNTPEGNAPDSIFDDLSALRRAARPTVKRETKVTEIGVKKPKNDIYFRVHDSEAMVFHEAPLLVDSKHGEFYFIGPNMLTHEKIKKRVRWYDITVVYVWPGGEIFLWPVPIIGAGKPFPAWKAQRDASEQGKTEWTQLVWDADQSKHHIETAEEKDGQVTIPPPIWPADLDLSRLMKLGFADRTITTPEHPYVMQLRGRAD
jgi:hypothetical protein